MQDDASKEGNAANAPIIRLPTREQIKLSPGKDQMDGGRNNASNEVRYVKETQPLSAR